MQCQHQAVLIETHPVEGTASNVAKRRVDLRCSLQAGHDSPHKDEEHAEEWADRGAMMTTILRHDEDE
jgi:hypothetical protein